MSSENLVEPCPQGEIGVRGLPDAQLACGDNPPRERQSQGGMQEEEVGDNGSLAHNNKIQEVTEPSEGVGQPQEGPETGLRANQRTSAARRSGEDGGPGVCLEEQCLSGSRRRPSPRGVVLLPYPERERDRRTEEPRGLGPFFFFGGGNGASIVTSYCESRGWQRIYDKTREDFKLKWCEIKSPVTYYNFKEGEQLLYQIPNNKVLTTKIGLLSSLREYDRVSSKVNHGRGLRRLKIDEFFPNTFRMDMRDEREAFFAQQEGMCDEETSVWICKPTGLNQGRGIFLLRSQEDISAFRLKLQNIAESQCNRTLPFRLPQARIVQQYVQNPLLLKGRKFDVRSYFLIACTSPYMAFFRHGYVRLTCDLYDPNSPNLSSHLTNQYMQKKNPLYSVLKEETVWSMDRFNTYVNDKLSVAKGLPKDWVLGAFAKRMQQIMIQCFFAVKAKLDRKLGYFDLIGCDFMIDDDFKVWLLEMNCNPALHTNCEVLKEVIPSTVVETLDLTLEIFNKCRCGLKLLPLASQRDFVLLYDGETAPVPVLSHRSKTAVRLRAQRPKSASTQMPFTTSRTQKAESVASVSREKSVSENTFFPVSMMAVLEPLTGIDATQTSVADHPSPVTTHNDPSLQAGPNRLTGPAGVLRPHPTHKPSPRPPKPAQARVELRLSKCTWQGRSGNSEHRKPPDLLWVKSTFMSLSTPAMTEGSRLSVRCLRASKACHPDQEQPFCYSLRPTQFRLAQPGTSGPVWTDKQDKEGGQEGEGGQEPGVDTQSAAKEEKEDKEHREQL
ncbi:protein polyglycylase TTLL10 [Coregonus clupeaformis]|uniref:protein polyglycylase TTLL10 n=1 Tax=Coregonus clupeaformis TaxID=59861 RepID=UPI001E1C335E|nr:protein polyglycylase TTLL10 [Coregonus clupeaformis]XP_045065258.1 protein polyglycylase TTLL10 [Coregonus clupeaformis]